MNKKKILYTYLFFIGFSFIIAGVLPSIIDNIEFNKLENLVLSVSNSINNEKIIKQIDKNLTIKNKNLENKIDNYLEKVINIGTSIYDIKNGNEFNNILSNNNLEKDNLDNINKELLKYKDDLNKIELEINDLNLNEVDNDYKYIIDKLDISNYKLVIDNLIIKIDSYTKIIEFLKNNDYKIENNNLIFLKRSIYNEFNSFLESLSKNELNIFKYGLVKDLEGPIINANDITIYEGIYIDLNNSFKCIDEVDGEVSCEVDGSYDKDVKGVYPIKVSAVDVSGIKNEKTINVTVVEKEKLKYYTEIIRNYNTVIVYELDENKEYTKIARVFPCSTGRNGRTPTGIFYSIKGYEWGPLMGGVWGQYYTVIRGNILFHSVPYYSMSKDNLEWEEYNKLGEEASAGCVRLSVIDAKWIYDNCPNGMKIKIYDGELPPGVEKPIALKIDGDSPYRGWDPTDPDINNPWNNISSE